MDDNQVPAGVTVNAALLFAAEAHGKQMRGEEPYLVHLIECVAILEDEFDVTDEATLIAAACHDVLEDTTRTKEALATFAGPIVAAVVEEATDDKSLSPGDRKSVKLNRAFWFKSLYSCRAKLVMMADKLSNVRSLIKAETLPDGWTEQELEGYLVWCASLAKGFVEVCDDENDDLQTLSAMYLVLRRVVEERTSVDIDSPLAGEVIDAYLKNVVASE